MTLFVRPPFNSAITSDRLREGFGLLPSSPSRIPKNRKSMFVELLVDCDCAGACDCQAGSNSPSRTAVPGRSNGDRPALVMNVPRPTISATSPDDILISSPLSPTSSIASS